MIDKLKPCPFCGETPDVNHPGTFQADQGFKYGHVVCCGQGPEVRTGYDPVEGWRDDAINAWNERALPQSTIEARAELERTKAELEKAQTQRDAMFHEIETLRGKTGYCIGCEAAAQKLAKLREAGEALAAKVPRWVRLRSGQDYFGDDEAVIAWRAAVGGGEESDGE